MCHDAKRSILVLGLREPLALVLMLRLLGFCGAQAIAVKHFRQRIRALLNYRYCKVASGRCDPRQVTLAELAECKLATAGNA